MGRAVEQVVTVLLSDLQGRTNLGERLDPQTLRGVMSRYFGALSEVVEDHGGRVERFIGDAVIAVFGEEGDGGAAAAVRAATELQRTLARLNHELDRDYGVAVTVRTSVSTGQLAAPETSTGLLTAEPAEVAARLLQTARPGEILIDERTRRLVGNAVAAENNPIVGRETELAQLVQAFERSVARRTAHVFTVLADAGVGKTRLAEELVDAVEGRASVFVGRCLPYGEGITFWPLAEIVRAAAGRLDRSGIERLLGDEPDAPAVADRIAQAVGVSEGRGGAGEETFWAVRKLVEALARERPLVLVLEDLHWAELPFLDLVEHLTERVLGVPVLLVCLARPALLEIRSRWLGGKLNVGSILLDPLSAAESEALVDRLLGESTLPEATRTKLVASTGGNPLFVEQTLALIRDLGGAGAQQLAPATIEELLVARLDRLGSAERSVIQRASVIGEEFWPGAVAALGPDEDAGDLVETLETLVTKELVHSERASAAGEGAYRFRHILIRDAAYASIPRAERVELHKRLADWIEADYPARLTEREEILGYHLEQAYRYRVELGPIDDSITEVGRAAGARLASAGRRAFDREDMSGAANLLSRALRLLPEGTARLELYPVPGEALECVGRHGEALRLVSEGLELARAAGDRRVAANALVRRAGEQFLTEPGKSGRDLIYDAEEAIAVLDEIEDDAGLAEAWRLVADVRILECRAAEAERALERALEHATRTGSLRRQALIASDLGWCLVEGPTPLEAARRFGEEWLTFARAKGIRILEGWVLQLLGAVEARRGHFNEGRRLLDGSRDFYQELGLPYQTAWCQSTRGTLELLAGDVAAAERELRSSFLRFEEMGVKTSFAETGVMLAEALYRQRHLDEAARFTEICEEAAPQHDAVCQVRWRATRAKVLAAAGSPAAEGLARAAVARAANTDYLCLETDALLALAEVLRLSDRPEMAEPSVAKALRLARRKGYVAAAGKG